MSSEPIVDLKKRIVGAIVLVSLAIIFLPMILKDNNHFPDKIKSSNIPPIPTKLKSLRDSVSNPINKPKTKEMPPLPKTKVIPLDNKNRHSVNKTVEKKQALKKVSQNKPKKVKANKVTPSKAKKVTQSYALQVGSFSSQRNAIDLKNKLRKKKYHAYIEVIKTSKGIHHRVRVGPYLKYDQIVAIQKKVKRNFKINAKIVNFR